MQYAQIVDNTVINVILWDGVIAERPDGWSDDSVWQPFPTGLEGQLIAIGAEPVQIGWTYDGGTFIAPQPSEPETPPVTSVTPRQARLALLAAGKLDAVEGAIAQLPTPQKVAAVIEWQFATTVQRDSPLVEMLGQALNLDIDALFAEAAKL